MGGEPATIAAASRSFAAALLWEMAGKADEPLGYVSASLLPPHRAICAINSVREISASRPWKGFLRTALKLAQLPQIPMSFENQALSYEFNK